MKHNGNETQRRQLALKRLKAQLANGKKVAKVKDGGGIIPLTEADSKRINGEITILEKIVGKS